MGRGAGARPPAPPTGGPGGDEVIVSGTGRDPASVAALVPFRRLDGLLAPAVRGAALRFGPDAAADAFRGLYITAQQAIELLDRPATPGPAAAVVAPSWAEIIAVDPAWAWLREFCGLSDTELDVVLLALGPEADLRYERLYGYLQDDVTRRHPTVDLALDLLTTGATERLEARALFAADAPLRAGRVVALHADARATAPPLPAHQLVVDPQVVDILLGHCGTDARLADCVELVAARELRSGAAPAALLGLAAKGHPVRLYFQGPPGSGRRAAAEALAAAHGTPLLAVALDRLPDADVALSVELLLRTATRHGALLYLPDADALGAERGAALRHALGRRLARHDGLVVLAGTRDWLPWGPRPLGVLTVPFQRADVAVRRAAWERALGRHAAPTSDADLDTLAVTFRIGPDRIDDAVLTALTAARARGTGAAPERAELFSAARAQSRHGLGSLARRIEPVHGWRDIVLPPDALDQLHELCDRVAYRGRVLDEWGFGATMSLGTGIGALFAGPPGTGKTMAAEVLARELGLDLYKIDLAAVVSKYIGETEKNLERVFTAAAETDAILLFDEADALFGKRSEVRDARDRYANIEVAYLLQRMEQHDGLAILSTNLRGNLDDAFTRRLAFVVDFPLPDVAERRRIWAACLPAATPRAADLDLDRLAADFRLAGGHIRNIVLAAAHRAAAERVPVGMSHMLAATVREHRKMGRIVAPALYDPALPDPVPTPTPTPTE